MHVVYTRNAAGVRKIYVDDVEVVSGTIGGDFSNWNTGYHLGLANEMTGDRPWLGEIYMFAICERALEAQEVHQNFAVGAPTAASNAPTIWFANQLPDPPGTLVSRDGGKTILPEVGLGGNRIRAVAAPSFATNIAY